MRDNRITQKLKAALQPTLLEVRDISHLHAGHAHAGVETHFTVKITSPHFKGLSRVAQHQLVNAALKDEFENGLHALALTTSAE
jgi:BolA family transcriptional regulator, general stress-responsive regulator